jgi:uracil-DNA glycosylase
MADDGVAYYDELEGNKPAPAEEGTTAKPSAPGTPKASQEKNAAAAPAAGEKRQRTLESMFGGAAAPKKAKLERPAGAPPLKKPAGAVPTLNSIPFSMAELEGALSDEERELLALELTTMGKSWYVSHSYDRPPQLADCLRVCRLKILKDEIRSAPAFTCGLLTISRHAHRKPYFLALKRFLKSEGVTPDDSNPSCKIYPPGRCSVHSQSDVKATFTLLQSSFPYHTD